MVKYRLMARRSKTEKWKPFSTRPPTTKTIAYKQLVEAKSTLKNARKHGLVSKRSGHQIKVIKLLGIKRRK